MTTRRLLPGVAGLVTLDLVGGALAVATRRNTVAEAWSAQAVLAAPLPMIGARVGLAAADRWDDRRGSLTAGLLGAACLVNGVSGFFDGQLGRADLPRRLVAFQLVLVGGTAAVGVRALRRAGRRPHVQPTSSEERRKTARIDAHCQTSEGVLCRASASPDWPPSSRPSGAMRASPSRYWWTGWGWDAASWPSAWPNSRPPG